jgi:hypothetical protein
MKTMLRPFWKEKKLPKNIFFYNLQNWIYNIRIFIFYKNYWYDNFETNKLHVPNTGLSQNNTKCIYKNFCWDHFDTNKLPRNFFLINYKIGEYKIRILLFTKTTRMTILKQTKHVPNTELSQNLGTRSLHHDLN